MNVLFVLKSDIQMGCAFLFFINCSFIRVGADVYSWYYSYSKTMPSARERVD